MKERKQSTTAYPMCFLMVSSTDHVSPVTGITPTVTISKNGGAFASPSGAVTEIGSGWYARAGNATDRATLGELLLHATGTGADPVDDRYMIVAYDPFDAVRLGLTSLPNAAADAAGGLPISDAGGLDLDIQLGKLVGTLATGTHNPQSGDAYARIGSAGAGLTAIGDTRMANLDTTVSSRSTLTAQQVWEYATRTLSSFGSLVSDITTAVWGATTRTLSAFGFNVTASSVTDKTGYSLSATPPTAAEIRAEIDSNSTQIAAVKTVTDDLAGMLQTDGAIKQFTENALELAPSSGGGGDATAANQTIIIGHLTDVKGATFSGSTDSLEAIRDRGDAAWTTGGGASGSNAITITVTDTSDVNIVEAAVEIWDSVGTSFIERKSSNSSGQAVFNLDDGTYMVKIHKSGYSIANQTLIVSGVASVTYEMTAFVIPAASDPDVCRIYFNVKLPSGGTITALTPTATITEYIENNICYTGSVSGVYDDDNQLVYWDAKRKSTAVLKISEISFEETVTVPDAATSELDDLLT